MCVPLSLGSALRRVCRSGAVGAVVGASLVFVHPGTNKLHAEPAAARAKGRAGAIAGCDVRREKRIFVGFSDDMTLDDFEAAAIHAERVLDRVPVDVCQAWASASPAVKPALSPVLRGVITAGARLSATQVRFTNRRLVSALVHLAASGAERAPTQWLAHLQRTGNDWHVLRVVAEGAPAQ